MSNLLFIGKELPDGLAMAEAFVKGGRQVFAPAKSQSDAASFESENIFSATWNKSSAVSAHSLLLRAETKFNRIDEALFYFDASYFAQKFELDKSEEISAAVDSMISSYLFAAAELLKRIDQLKEKITVAFLVKEYPSRYETAFSKQGGVLPASSIVNTAQAAFIAAAENFSINVNDRNYLSVILAKCPFNNEFYKNEGEIASWLAGAFDSVENMKNPQTAKLASAWNKVGSKVQTGFSLFK